MKSESSYGAGTIILQFNSCGQSNPSFFVPGKAENKMKLREVEQE